ncbi:sensor histidine kinase [Roseivirga pacifica]|uniref:sensor histidine kinase n=1 Tax=Roseivirga pacifica TaxID=1267423 RepID=UPI003BAE988B
MNQQQVTDLIASFPAFEEVPLEQIAWMVERGEYLEIKAGEVFYKRGDPVDKLTILLEGLAAFRMEQNGQYKEMIRFVKGDITGALPYSRAFSGNANGAILSDSKIFTLNKSHFQDLVSECHDLAAMLVHRMTDRVRDMVRLQQQNEKLMALGKLSAGLAHELNNPAAAIVRSSETLQKHLGTVPDKLKRMMTLEITDEQIDQINVIVFGKLNRTDSKPLSMLEKSSLEDDLVDWLEGNGYGDCYMLSETLADYGFSPTDLQNMKEEVGPKQLPMLMEWIDNVLTTQRMIGEIKEASNRISSLVNSVKSYSHMDRANEMEATNVHQGILNTLTILNHKIKQNRVDVVDNLAENIPMISASPGELNQVWTNVIDNALDAMEETGGTLAITSWVDGDSIKVTIADSGSGIPADIQDRIFEPFFTTKDIGKGTGLGLETVKLIVDKHKGSIKLNSNTEGTTFEFCFPIKG